jgi:hypothetical protein
MPDKIRIERKLTGDGDWFKRFAPFLRWLAEQRHDQATIRVS